MSRRYGGFTGHSRRRSPFRPIFLGVILLAVCWAFWNNNQRRLDIMVEQSLFTDETETVSAAHRAEIIKYLKEFKRTYGVPLEVHIRKEPPALNAHDDSKMYLDIVPPQRRMYLSLPPLVRRAVGSDFIRDMELSFRQDFASGDWRPGLLSAIRALQVKMAEVTR